MPRANGHRLIAVALAPPGVSEDSYCYTWFNDIFTKIDAPAIASTLLIRIEPMLESTDSLAAKYG